MRLSGAPTNHVVAFKGVQEDSNLLETFEKCESSISEYNKSIDKYSVHEKKHVLKTFEKSIDCFVKSKPSKSSKNIATEIQYGLHKIIKEADSSIKKRLTISKNKLARFIDTYHMNNSLWYTKDFDPVKKATEVINSIKLRSVEVSDEIPYKYNANLAIKNKDYKKAETNLTKNLTLLINDLPQSVDKFQSCVDIGEDLLELGNVYNKLNEPKKALSSYQNATTVLEPFLDTKGLGVGKLLNESLEKTILQSLKVDDSIAASVYMAKQHDINIKNGEGIIHQN